MLAELRRVLIRAENDTQKELSAKKPVQAGIWIEQMSTMPLAAQGRNAAPVARGGDPRYGGYSPPVGLNPPNTPPREAAPANPETAPSNIPEGTINLVCRAVSLSSVDQAANPNIAYALQKELQASPYFDPGTTQLSGEISVDDVTGTFTFGISVMLKKPLKL